MFRGFQLPDKGHHEPSIRFFNNERVMSTSGSSTPRPVKVVIVGAGIAGSVLALALRRLAQTSSRSHISLQLILVDAASTFRAVGAGFGLTANGIHPIRQLGLVDRLMEVSMPLRSIQQHKVVEKAGVKTGTLLMHSVVPERQFGEPVVVGRTLGSTARKTG